MGINKYIATRWTQIDEIYYINVTIAFLKFVAFWYINDFSVKIILLHNKKYASFYIKLIAFRLLNLVSILLQFWHYSNKIWYSRLYLLFIKSILLSLFYLSCSSVYSLECDIFLPNLPLVFTDY